MKKLIVLTLGVGLWAVTGVDAAAQFGRPIERARGDQVCVYKDINYQGAEQCYNPNEEIGNLGAHSKSISSIRVYGRTTVTVYENTAFRGRSELFSSDVPDLGRRLMSGNTMWSDHIDSLRIGGGSSGNFDVTDRSNPGPFWRNPPEPRDGLCIYDRPNYGGRSQCWNEGQNISDLARQGNWNGQISSIRLFGRSVAVVYQNTGYRGESLNVDRDIPDLAEIGGRGRGNGNGNGNSNSRGQENGRGSGGWDTRISSVQIQTRRR